ncbi:DUF3987 domain-containing protein [bacterium]|nr:DUF3987 domain-containing protein [bacterium]
MNLQINEIQASDIVKNKASLLENTYVSSDWPILAPEALYGLAGEIVRSIDPFTEADPVAVLVNILTAFGNLIGAGPHFKVECHKHSPRLFIALVGETSKGRKGTSWSTPKYLMTQLDPSWPERITSGLSSGEGLIYHVRDPRVEKRPIKKNNIITGYQDEIVDQGVTDKRLLIVEEELASVLKMMRREGNILSGIMREGWDTGDLHPLTKNNPIKATGAHISIIGHITSQELLRYLQETEMANGFANRFIWFSIRRSKIISNPKGTPPDILTSLTHRTLQAFERARHITYMERTPEAETLWEQVYPKLSEGKPGIVGAILGRAEAQVMRIACLYALFEGRAEIAPAHLKAALALWDYSEASVNRIFGNKTGDVTADRIMEALIKGPMTETEIYNLFNKHKASHERERALKYLEQQGKIRKRMEDTGGCPKTIWARV